MAFVDAHGNRVQEKRSITRHVYRGVYFYSSDGGSLGPKQQAGIVAAAQKIPEKVWSRLASAGTRIFIMKNKDDVMSPKIVEYMQAIGIPKKVAIASFKGEKDSAYTDKDRHPVAVVGVGELPPYPSGMKRPKPAPGEGTPHIVQHETAHAVDFTFRVMKAIGMAYEGAERKSLVRQAKAVKTIERYRSTPMSVVKPGRMDVSALGAFRDTIPQDYTAGYGDSRKDAPQYDQMGKYPAAEVFAEALAHYWNGAEIPPQMKTFFDDYFKD